VNEVAVGRLIEIWRYPVKSMAGESLPRADVCWQGLAGDRRWAFIRPGIPRSGFSRLTIRQQPHMALPPRVRRAGRSRPLADDRPHAGRPRPRRHRPAPGRRVRRRPPGDQAGPRDPRLPAPVADHHPVDRPPGRSARTGRRRARRPPVSSQPVGRALRPRSPRRTAGSAPCCGSARCRAADRLDADARRSPGSRARRPGPGVSKPATGRAAAGSEATVALGGPDPGRTRGPGSRTGLMAIWAAGACSMANWAGTSGPIRHRLRRRRRSSRRSSIALSTRGLRCDATAVQAATARH
jgi:hypothetical protein